MPHEILVYNKTKFLIPRKFVVNVILKSLKNLGIKQPVEMAVLVVGDKKIRRLNRIWRRKNRATNVLSFPQMTKPELKKSVNFGSGSRKLGKPARPEGGFDLQSKSVISLGQILIDPHQILSGIKKNRKDFEKELIKLVIHGLLHLLGYDHKTTKEGREMAAREEKILKNIKL